MDYPAPQLERAVEALSRLPSVGRKTALRLALHLIKAGNDEALSLADALRALKTETRLCPQCHNLTEAELCGICSNPKREARQICVVEDLRDMLAVERTGLYRGHYHLLGGLISPMDGVGPEQLWTAKLFERAQADPEAEVILALSSRMEGETTAFYLARRLRQAGVRVTTLARGLPLGGELEYADEATLARSLEARVPYTLPEGM